MFNPRFTDADAARLLTDQHVHAHALLHSALTDHPPRAAQLHDWLRTHHDRLQSNPQHIHDAGFIQIVQSHALALSRSGEHDAALAWGRAAYSLSRRFAHGWFALLDIVIAAGAIPSISSRSIPVGRIGNSGPLIPPRLMQFWDRPVPPADVGALMDKMQSMNPQWFYHRITDARARQFLDQHFGPRVVAAYNTLSHVAARSDLFRACWLYQRGGVYADADEDCTRPVEHILPSGSRFVLSWSNGAPSCINNWFVAIAPAHPMMKRIIMLALHQIEETVRRNLKLNAWVLTGPGVYTMACLDCITLDPACYDISDLSLINEVEYRRTLKSPEMLAYRHDPKANWRLENLA